eukprot:CAMPEP_0194504510 /NCGR_PEP_ID=MMETSP0253-20130528/28987_1 /TAXON_ID=2966 /ORGANISM="Noctiluca scintillans" /LENGTH=273 /DNA_ID=CAMNT_0039346909 /DNA_START=271 /DNA_END=1092 /DNA_ORIENTATION=+
MSHFQRDASEMKTFDFAPKSCEYNSTEFDAVYLKSKWSHVKKDLLKPRYYFSYGVESRSSMKRKSHSGRGSNVGYFTAVSLDFLSRAITENGIRTMLDVPCGDVNWQFEAWETESLDAYLGLDVAGVVIEMDQIRFKHHANKRFAAWDFARCPLPMRSDGDVQTPFDLIHVRDVIQHMRLADGVAAMCHVAQSGATYLISTTFPGERNFNVAFDDGVDREGRPPYYANNLLAPPFSFPPGKDCVPTHPKGEADETCLWNIADLQTFVSNSCKQ